MKFLGAALISLLMTSFGTADAQALPNTASTSFSVVNMSQGNQDASVVGANPGDVLRFSYIITSDSEDVKNFVPSFNVANILSGAEIIDTQLGTLAGSTLTYPEYSHAAPCSKEWVFVARVKDCGEVNQVSSTALPTNQSAMAPLMCEEKPLVNVGPEQNQWWVVVALVVFGILALAVVPNRVRKS